MRRATDEARGYYYPRLYGCRGVSCFGLHAGAFATELFAGVAPQSRDDVLLDATLTLTMGGLGKAGRSADDLRDLARQFHRDESGAIKLEEFARAKERFRQRTIGRLLAAKARKAAGFADEGVPIIVDQNIEGSQRLLRQEGFNARSVQEIFGDPTTSDRAIGDLADLVGGRIVTKDLARNVGEPDAFQSVDRLIQVPGSLSTRREGGRLVDIVQEQLE